MFMNKLMKFALPAAMFLPLLAGAAGLTEVVRTIDGLVRSIVPIIMVLAILYFFWGLVKYIQAAGDPEKASEGKSIMIYGIIALFVMASIWGLVEILQDTFIRGGGRAPEVDDILPR